MNSKKCGRCGEEKSLDEFNKSSVKKDGLATVCRLCNREYLKNHYYSNKEYYYQKSKNTRRAYRERISKLKENTPCSDCGNKFPPICMDYDHIEDNKINSVAVLVTIGSWESIMKEIEKCELVCSNCHRIRTQKRRSGMV